MNNWWMDVEALDRVLLLCQEASAVSIAKKQCHNRSLCFQLQPTENSMLSMQSYKCTRVLYLTCPTASRSPQTTFSDFFAGMLLGTHLETNFASGAKVITALLNIAARQDLCIAIVRYRYETRPSSHDIPSLVKDEGALASCTCHIPDFVSFALLCFDDRPTSQLLQSRCAADVYPL